MTKILDRLRVPIDHIAVSQSSQPSRHGTTAQIDSMARLAPNGPGQTLEVHQRKRIPFDASSLHCLGAHSRSKYEKPEQGSRAQQRVACTSVREKQEAGDGAK